MSDFKIKKSVQKKAVYSVHFSSEEVADILREYVNAPRAYSCVEFDIGYDGWLSGVDISWEEVFHED